MEGFAVTCPLAPDVPHLISDSCSSSRVFGLGFLQTPSRDDALALLLAFGSANTWREDFHLTSSVPCPAHTPAFSRVRLRTSAATRCTRPTRPAPSPHIKKDICLYKDPPDPAGSSNHRIRSWIASLSRSILIRWPFIRYARPQGQRWDSSTRYVTMP
jgi:hypothetical protein